MDNDTKLLPPLTAPKKDMDERLQNVLSHRGIASRRHAAEMIEQGLVTVNGTRITEPGFRVNPDTDTIIASGEVLAKETEQQRTVLFTPPAASSPAPTARAAKRCAICSVLTSASGLFPSDGSTRKARDCC